MPILHPGMKPSHCIVIFRQRLIAINIFYLNFLELKPYSRCFLKINNFYELGKMRIFRLPSKTGFNVKIIISYYLTIIICVVLFSYTRTPSYKKIGKKGTASSQSQPCVSNCEVVCPTLPFVDLTRYFVQGMSKIYK